MTGNLTLTSQAGFLRVLGAHEGEQLLDDPASGVLRAGAADSTSQRNDRRIIEIALHWNAEIAVPGCVMLVSSDAGAVATAKAHRLPAAPLRAVHTGLAAEHGAAWTAPLWRRVLARAFAGPDGAPLGAPIRPVRSVHSVLADAAALVDRMAEALAAGLSGTTAAALAAEGRAAAAQWREMAADRALSVSKAAAPATVSAAAASVSPQRRPQVSPGRTPLPPPPVGAAVAAAAVWLPSPPPVAQPPALPPPPALPAAADAGYGDDDEWLDDGAAAAAVLAPLSFEEAERMMQK
jgi:hypothetical protein